MNMATFRMARTFVFFRFLNLARHCKNCYNSVVVASLGFRYFHVLMFFVPK
jgi:hypothetical protein